MPRAARAKIEESDDELDFVLETNPSQLPDAKKAKNFVEEIVSDSQGEESDDDAAPVASRPVNTSSVSSQMNFFPMFTSTQRVKKAPSALASSFAKPSQRQQQHEEEEAAGTTKERKRKKTSALRDPPAKKPTTTDRSFAFVPPPLAAPSPSPSKMSSLFPSQSAKRVKTSLSAIEETFDQRESVTFLEETTSRTRRKAPRAPAVVKEPKLEETKLLLLRGSQRREKEDKIDMSLVSSGKTYEVEEASQSFLHHRAGRNSMFSEKDISMVVANMNDLVEVMAITRRSPPPTPLSLRTASQQNVKKFRKAAQGRYNPQLPVSHAVIGEDDLKDWRSFEE